MVSLGQIVSEALEYGLTTKRVATACAALVSHFGNELAVLLDAPEEDIAALAGERTAQGISRVRRGDLEIEPGYDGVYGSVSIWPGR
jgi:PHP family Zn ribbon phosphoesterase